jgi:hypothetical protein
VKKDDHRAITGHVMVNRDDISIVSHIPARLEIQPEKSGTCQMQSSYQRLGDAQRSQIHPSREISETNSNYANLLTIYDRLLGTYTPAERAASVVCGLDDADRTAVASFPGRLSVPFRESEKPFVPDTKVRIGASTGQ